MENLIVKTQYGLIEGKHPEGEYAHQAYFLGIPYAKPPIGDLRFRVPEKPEPWDGIKDCKEYGHCPLVGPVFGRKYYDSLYNSRLGMSEDCLYLNVFVNHVDTDKKRPVFVWFHGGGLGQGTPQMGEFEPGRMCDEDIVCVSIAHRLNVLGYLALPQLSAEQGGKSGNYGLMDLILAMEWVKDNISAFGGDPNNITVSGCSGGTQKCMCIIASPNNKTPIKRAMLLSGNKYLQRDRSLAESEAAGIETLKALGLDPNITPEDLRKVDFYSIMLNPPKMPGSAITCGGHGFPGTLRENWDNYARAIDMWLGCTTGESDPLARTETINVFETKGITNAEEFYAHYKNLLGDLYNKYDFENIVKTDDEHAADDASLLAAEGLCKYGRLNFSRSLTMNREFGMYWARKYPESKIYASMFGYRAPIAWEDEAFAAQRHDTLVDHGQDCRFWFGYVGHEMEPTRDWREKDIEEGKMTFQYCLNFLKTGNPNGSELQYWPAASENYGYAKFLDDGITTGEGINTPLEKLIREWTSREYAFEA